MKIQNVALLFMLVTILFTSCKKDVEGCTDPKADNYNADANVSSDDCTYQKRFAGTYDCTFGCKGTLSGVFQTAEMTISELAVKSEVNLIIQSTIGPIPVKGTIIPTDSVKVDQTLDNLEVVPEIFFPGTGTTPIKVTGTVKTTLGVSDDNKKVSGIIFLTLANKEPVIVSGIPFPAGTLQLSDSCDFTGNKR